jgi:MFS transporter, PPP family, 3-phenylpropionic acid transporter
MATDQTTTIAAPLPRLLYAKAFYFSYFAALGGYMFFLTLYYKQIGLDDRQIGLIVGLPPLMTLISAPLWGQMRDRLGGGRWLLPLVCLSTLPLVYLISQTRSFALIIPLTLAYAFFQAPIAPLGDHLTLTMLGEQRHLYGQQRIWGAIGFGASAWVAGALGQRFGLGWIFAIYIGLMVLCALIAVNLGAPGQPSAPEEHHGSTGLGTLLRRPLWQLFLLSLFLLGASINAANNFFPLFLQDLGGGAELFGFSIAISTLSELPIFIFSAQLLRRWGAGRMLIAAMALFVLRWLFFSIAWTPALAVAGQALHGVTFSVLWIAGVSYAEQQAPARLGATAQGLFSGTIYGISAVGSVVGGLIYAVAGPAALFQAAAVAAFVALLVFLGAHALERRNTDL